jgi:predicted RNase H-like HicB family nuclease
LRKKRILCATPFGANLLSALVLRRWQGRGANKSGVQPSLRDAPFLAGVWTAMPNRQSRCVVVNGEDHINVFYSEEDCYIPDIHNLKRCSACGDTREEAVRQVQIFKKAWLQASRKSRNSIPLPKYRP